MDRPRGFGLVVLYTAGTFRMENDEVPAVLIVFHVSSAVASRGAGPEQVCDTA